MTDARLSHVLPFSVLSARSPCHSEYTHFMKVVLQIVSIINEKSYTMQQQESGPLNGHDRHSYANLSMHTRTIAERQRL